MSSAIVVALAVLGAACSKEAPVAPPSSAASSSSVRWRAVRGPGETALLEAPARVVPDANGHALVTAPLRARVVAIRVALGSEVVAGVPLVEIAMPEAAIAAAEYLAALDQLEASQRRAAQLAELRSEGLARASEISALEIDLAKLRGARDVAAATLHSANVPLRDARAMATGGGRTTLRASRAGRITRLAAVVGATVAPEDPLIEIAGSGSTRVEATLAYPLPPGSRFTLQLGGASSEARLVGVAPARDADGTSRAWFDVDQPLPSGAPGRIRVMPPGTTVTVPAAAVATDDQGTFVWRRENGQARRLGVQVLITSGADALVTGPSEGDSIASVASSVAGALQ